MPSEDDVMSLIEKTFDAYTKKWEARLGWPQSRNPHRSNRMTHDDNIEYVAPDGVVAGVVDDKVVLVMDKKALKQLRMVLADFEGTVSWPKNTHKDIAMRNWWKFLWEVDAS